MTTQAWPFCGGPSWLRKNRSPCTPSCRAYCSWVVVRPRRVLVATFTNRARDNVRDRLRMYLPYTDLRDCVTISNFHGFSARVFRAHADVIGMDPEMTLPESDWWVNSVRAEG